MNTRYLSIKEVAALLKIHPKTANKMANKGEIPGHFKLGSIHFIDEEVFHASLKLLAQKKTVSRSITQDNRPNRHGLLK
jgi:excisionase family DNA binding protein